MNAQLHNRTVPALLAAIALSAVIARSQQPVRPAVSAIVGNWHGTSTCVRRDIAPACTDEEVVYGITPMGSHPDSVMLAADKIVRGVRQPMGDMAFGCDTSGRVWTCEFHNSRVHGKWIFTLADTVITGVLLDIPSGVAVREVRVTRSPSPASPTAR